MYYIYSTCIRSRPSVRPKNNKCFLQTNRAKLLSLCFWPQKISIR